MELLSGYRVGIVFTVEPASWAGILPARCIYDAGSVGYICDRVLERQRAMLNTPATKGVDREMFIAFDGVDVPDQLLGAAELDLKIVHTSADVFAGRRLLDAAAWGMDTMKADPRPKIEYAARLIL